MVTFTGPFRRRRCTHALGRQVATALPGAVNALVVTQATRPAAVPVTVAVPAPVVVILVRMMPPTRRGVAAVAVAVTAGGVGEPAAKVALTLVAWVIVTVQVVEVPVQAPPQLLNTESTAGCAVRVMLEPIANTPLQVSPQSMPCGAEVTDPDPAPERVTVRRSRIPRGGWRPG